MAIDSIKRGARQTPPRIVIYGVGGIGKTTWAANSPDPIFLMTEEGQGNLDIARFELRENDPVLRSWDELTQCCDDLITEDHDFRTVVVDSLDFAEALCRAHVCEKNGWESIETPGYGKGYQRTAEVWRELLAKLEQIQNERGMGVICIAHEEVVRFEDPASEAYDHYDICLHKHTRHTTANWADAVFFANFKHHIIKEQGKFGDERKRAAGRGERILYTDRRPSHRAKNRWNLPDELPLDWEAFINAMSQEN